MFFSFLTTVFTSIISGGATGILGVAVQRIFDLKNRKLDLEFEASRMEHEIHLREIDMEMMVKEAEAKVRVAEVEGNTKIEVADSEAFAQSFNEPKRYMTGDVTKNQGWALIFLDFVRGLVRPGLTVYLCVITTAVYFQAYSLLEREGVSLDVGNAMKLIELVVGTILYLTTTCVLWWFGTRNKQKPPKVRL